MMRNNRGSGIKIILAITGFLVMTLIFFGTALVFLDSVFLDNVFKQPVETVQVDQKDSPPVVVEDQAIPRYDSYNFLNEAEKIAYTKIVSGLGDYKKKIAVTGIDTSQVERVLMAIDNDHSEIFWVAELAYYFNEYNDQVSQVEAKYDYDEAEKDRRQGVIDQAYSQYLSGLDGGMDEYEIVKYTYEYVVKNTVYGANDEDQNIYSVFALRESVCAGYAKAVKYLLDRQGIESSYVAGFVDVQGAHAWNLVLMDGDYYYLDATWGEFDGGLDPQQNISYDYFGVTTKTLELSHEIDTSLVIYPEFTATAANYFVRENRLYDLSKETEKMRLKNDLLRGKTSDQAYFYFAVTDRAMMTTAETLMDDALGNYTFFVDDQLQTFTISL